MPDSAVIHIQNTAPGPPSAMAVATPAILPVPMVAASAVIRDWNGVISPASPMRAVRPCIISRNAAGKRSSGIPARPTIR